MKKNKILSAICAISMVATLLNSVSVFAYVTETEVKAAVEEMSVRYVADESNVYTNGSTVKFKVYVDNMPTLDGITNTGSSKSPKYNGSALSQWMVSCSPTVGDKWELMDIPGSGLTSDSATYGEAADKFSISFVGMKTDEYVDSSYFTKEDAYWAELEIVLSADVAEEEITIPVVVEAVFQCGQNTNQLKQVNFKDAAGLKLAPKAEVVVNKYNVSVGTVENGIVTLDKTGEVEENTTVTVTATADEGYELEGIYVNDAKIDGTSFVVTADSVVTAKFTKLIVPATATYVEQKQEGTVYGLKGEIAANSQKVTGVTFNLSNGTDTKPVNAIFTQAVSAGSNVTFGVNITGIPAGINLNYVDSLAPVAE